MTGASVAEYWDYPMNAWLAVALTVTQTACDRLDVRQPDVDQLLDHLWAWISLSQEGFDQWYAYDSPPLYEALDMDLPHHITRAFAAAGVDDDTLIQWFQGLVEIVYLNLFGAVDRTRTWPYFTNVLAVTESQGVTLPPARSLSSWTNSNEGDGWGRKLGVDEVSALRRQLLEQAP